MIIQHRVRKKPTVVSIAFVLAMLLIGPPAQAGLLDSLLSTVSSVYDPLIGADGLLTGLIGKYSEDLQAVAGGPADQQVQVIVQTYAPPDTNQLNLLQLLGGLLKTPYSSIPGYAATVPAGSLLQIASDSNVERISADSRVKAHLDIAYRAVRGDRAAALSGWWGSGLTGRGIGVALIDTGVQLHQDFKRPIGSKPIIEVEIVGHEPGLADYVGNGTHVAGNLYGNRSAASHSLLFRNFQGRATHTQLISPLTPAPDHTGQNPAP